MCHRRSFPEWMINPLHLEPMGERAECSGAGGEKRKSSGDATTKSILQNDGGGQLSGVCLHEVYLKEKNHGTMERGWKYVCRRGKPFRKRFTICDCELWRQLSPLFNYGGSAICQVLHSLIPFPLRETSERISVTGERTPPPADGVHKTG